MPRRSSRLTLSSPRRAFASTTLMKTAPCRSRRWTSKSKTVRAKLLSALLRCASRTCRPRSCACQKISSRKRGASPTPDSPFARITTASLFFAQGGRLMSSTASARGRRSRTMIGTSGSRWTSRRSSMRNFRSRPLSSRSSCRKGYGTSSKRMASWMPSLR